MTAAEYRQFDATGLAQLVKNKSVHPSELVELAIEQASIHNPKLNAIVFPLYELAKEMAQQVDLDSPFAGVPILLKDLGVHLKGYPMSNGSRGWDKNIPDQDDYFVQQMRRAGFLFLGKTNTPELGLAPYTEPELFGPTRNPLDTTRTAGGSSGGSGAAVAAGIVPIATASDGGGSIRIPASCNGLFGLKPSRGRISLGPQIGQSWSGAVVQGCVSRSVRDTAAFLDATAGFFPGDPYALPTPPKSFTKAIEEAPTTYRIGFSTQHTLGHQLAPSCIQAVEQVA
ncbi:MAG: amidase family protein, partial [Bacteroidota bacterium]